MPRILDWNLAHEQDEIAWKAVAGERIMKLPLFPALATSDPPCDTPAVRPYEEIVEFIASLSPREVVEFKPSEAARHHVWDLIERQKTAQLPADEQAELDHYLEVEHLMRLAKARARQLLVHGQ